MNAPHLVRRNCDTDKMTDKKTPNVSVSRRCVAADRHQTLHADREFAPSRFFAHKSLIYKPNPNKFKTLITEGNPT